MDRKFTLRIIEEESVELENLKVLSGEKSDSGTIRFLIRNYARLNNRFQEEQRIRRQYEDELSRLKGVIRTYTSALESLKNV